jgi:hypothetical protein
MRFSLFGRKVWLKNGQRNARPPICCGEQVNVRLIRVKSFDPLDGSSWITILNQLEGRFIWLPWNWITNKQSLACLPMATFDSADWQKPAYIVPPRVASDEASVALRDRKADGVAVASPSTIRTAE